MLHHRVISIANILVNSDGDLVSIEDSECIAAVPIWQACELPKLLQGGPIALTGGPPPLMKLSMLLVSTTTRRT